MSLNPEQKKASEHMHGPLMIVAGAGTGKTTMVTHRIANLVRVGKIDPYNILAVTFTKKAAREMEERMAKFLTEEEMNRLTMSTFHSFCAYVLRREWKHLNRFTEAFSIIDPSGTAQFIRYIIKGKTKAQPGTYAKYISSLKNEMVDAQAYKYKGSTNKFIDWEKVKAYIAGIDPQHLTLLEDVYLRYDEIMKEKNQVDYDDLILLTVELFQNHPQVLEKYQERFRYIMVDEYQDTNRTQYALMTMLGSKYQNVAVVGDDYQAIYKFRGSDIRNILSFDQDNKGTTEIKLETNYRSTKHILQASNALIGRNTQQRKKNLRTEKVGGDKVRVVTAKNDKEVADYIAVDMSDKMKSGKVKFNDFAILYRTNAQSFYVEQALKYFKVPYVISSGRGFYDREEIQDIMHYLMFIHNYGDINAFNRAIRKPKRRIAEATVEKIAELAYDKNIMEVLKGAEKIVRMQKIAKEESLKFVKLIERMTVRAKTESVADLIESLLQEIDYKGKVLDTYDKETRENKEENIEMLIRDIRLKEEAKGEVVLLTEMLEDMMLYQTDNLDEQGEQVQLMTLHASKGLEFKYVYMIGLNEEVFPSYKSIADNDIEEERRLCYVGMTRAKEVLHMCRTRKRLLKSGIEKDMYPSRFLDELDPLAIEYFEV